MTFKSKYFKESEFRCKHCGKVKVDPHFLTMLDALRERCGFPVTILSGYRCPTHNQNVSSTGPRGPHTTGKAVDIAVSRHLAHSLLTHSFALGFTGIGVQQKGASRFIHLDILEEPEHAPRPTVWSY